MNKIAIILPAYNEESTIAATIKDFFDACPTGAIWVINNQSNDLTEKIALDTISNLGCLGGVLNERRRGKGNAVRFAFSNIDADIYVLADADLTYPAFHVNELIAPIINNEADMVVGDRHSSGFYITQNKRLFHKFGNDLVRILVNKLFSANLIDIMSGYRAFNRFFVKNYPILVEGFEIETDMTIHALDKRFRIKEIPINYYDRPIGSISKLNTICDGFNVLKMIVNILRYYRPLFFFSVIGGLFFVIALLAGAPVIKQWIYEGYITHVPLAILAASLMIIALIFMAIGIILDSIIQKDKRNYERDLLSNKI